MTHKRGHKTRGRNGKTRRTRRRGGDLRDYVPGFLKKKDTAPMTMAQYEAKQAEEAERRLGVSTPDRNPIVDKQLTEEQERIRREEGNHAAYEFGEYARDKFDKGGRRRTKRSKKRR